MNLFRIGYRKTWQFQGGAGRYAYDNEQITYAYLGGRGELVRRQDLRQPGQVQTRQHVLRAGIATMSGSIVGQPLYIPESYAL